MGWKEFWASIAASISWPIVVFLLVIVALIMFGGRLRGVLENTEGVSVGFNGLSFSLAAKNLKNIARQLPEDGEVRTKGGGASSELFVAWKETREKLRILYKAATFHDSHDGDRSTASSLFLRGDISSDALETFIVLDKLAITAINSQERIPKKDLEAVTSAAVDLNRYLEERTAQIEAEGRFDL